MLAVSIITGILIFVGYSLHCHYRGESKLSSILITIASPIAISIYISEGLFLQKIIIAASIAAIMLIDFKIVNPQK